MARLFIALMIVNLAGTSGLYFAKADGWKPNADSQGLCAVMGFVQTALAFWGLWVLLHV